MMRMLAMLACMAIAMLSFTPAHAQTRVELLGTWPAGEQVTLHHTPTVDLPLGYTSDQPVHIWVQPYFEGKPVNAGTNPSRTYPAGSGEALGWFFLDPGAQVDSVQVKAGDGSYNRTPVVADFPVSVTSDDESIEAPPPPAWLTTLRTADEAASRADYEKAMNTPPSAGDNAIILGFIVAVLAAIVFGVVTPVWCVWHWRGGWRIAAAVPVAIMTFVVLRILIGTAIDPTSHNLWPFEILMWGALSAIAIVVLMVARKISGAGQR